MVGREARQWCSNIAAPWPGRVWHESPTHSIHAACAVFPSQSCSATPRTLHPSPTSVARHPIPWPRPNCCPSQPALTRPSLTMGRTHAHTHTQRTAPTRLQAHGQAGFVWQHPPLRTRPSHPNPASQHLTHLPHLSTHAPRMAAAGSSPVPPSPPPPPPPPPLLLLPTGPWLHTCVSSGQEQSKGISGQE